MNLQWDPVISLGDIFTMAAFLFAGLKMYGDFRQLKFQVDHLWNWFDKNYTDFPGKDVHGKTR